MKNSQSILKHLLLFKTSLFLILLNFSSCSTCPELNEIGEEELIPKCHLKEHHLKVIDNPNYVNKEGFMIKGFVYAK